MHTVIPHTVRTIFHQDSTNPPGKVSANHFNISRRRTLLEPVSRVVFSFSSVSGLREALQNAGKAFSADFFPGSHNAFRKLYSVVFYLILCFFLCCVLYIYISGGNNGCAHVTNQLQVVYITYRRAEIHLCPFIFDKLRELTGVIIVAAKLIIFPSRPIKKYPLMYTLHVRSVDVTLRACTIRGRH